MVAAYLIDEYKLRAMELEGTRSIPVIEYVRPNAHQEFIAMPIPAGVGVVQEGDPITDEQLKKAKDIIEAGFVFAGEHCGHIGVSWTIEHVGTGVDVGVHIASKPEILNQKFLMLIDEFDLDKANDIVSSYEDREE